MKKHTQGEWEISNKMSNGIVDTQDAFSIVNVENGQEEWDVACVWKDVGSYKESEANAKLIAAAPKLLEALTECRRVLVKVDKDDALEAAYNALEAIKQATE